MRWQDIHLPAVHWLVHSLTLLGMAHMTSLCPLPSHQSVRPFVCSQITGCFSPKQGLRNFANISEMFVKIFQPTLHYFLPANCSDFSGVFLRFSHKGNSHVYVLWKCLVWNCWWELHRGTQDLGFVWYNLDLTLLQQFSRSSHKNNLWGHAQSIICHLVSK